MESTVSPRGISTVSGRVRSQGGCSWPKNLQTTDTAIGHSNVVQVTSASCSQEERYCLICGHDFALDDEQSITMENIVKQEVDANSDNVDEMGANETIPIFPNTSSSSGSIEEELLRDEGTTNKDDQSCFARSRRISIQNVSRTTKWTEDDKTVYQWFLTRLKVTSITKSRKRPNLTWNGNSGKDCVPFCGFCKSQLMGLFQLERKIDELQNQLKNGVQTLKDKINSHETVFMSNDIYAKDVRYERVRKHIVNKKFNKNVPNGQPGTKKCRTSTRKEIRAAAVSKQDKQDADELQLLRSKPVVVIPSPDKRRADLQMLVPDVKPDVREIHVGNSEKEEDTICDEKTNNNENVELEQESRIRSSTRKRKCRFNLADVSSLFADEVDDPDADVNHSADALEEGTTDEDLKGRKESSRVSTKKRKSKRKKKRKDKDWTPDAEDKGVCSDVEEGDQDMSEDEVSPQQRLNRYVLDEEKKTLTYLNLVFHHLEPYTDNRYRCSKCNTEVLHQRQRIRSHYLAKHSDKFACKRCDFRTYQRKKLQDHILVVHENHPKSECYVRHPCRFCGKPLIYAHRRGHEWTHKNAEEKRQAISTGSKEVPWERKAKQRVQCDECGKQFVTPYLLKQHHDRHHLTKDEKEAKKELCQECGGRFTELRKHYQRHHAEQKIFQCMEPESESSCGKIFKSLKELTRHKNAVHRKIREFKCPLCPREFTLEVNLNHHMNLHNGIRPYQCNLCPVAFSRVYHLQRHVATFHNKGEGEGPRRKSYMRGPTMLEMDRKKRELIAEGKYLPPSALATWAAGREPTSHFPLGSTTYVQNSEEKHGAPG